LDYNGPNSEFHQKSAHLCGRELRGCRPSGSGNSGVNYISVLTSEIDPSTNRFIASGSTPRTYDAAGNITIDTKFRGLKYDYDANGRQSAVKLLDNTSIQSSVYDCAGQRVQTTDGNKSRTMVYDVFGQDVADYLGSSGALLERENIYRGGQLLATFETGAAATPTGLAATAESGSITLSWSAASGATNYHVEREGAGGLTRLAAPQLQLTLLTKG